MSNKALTSLFVKDAGTQDRIMLFDKNHNAISIISLRTLDPANIMISTVAVSGEEKYFLAYDKGTIVIYFTYYRKLSDNSNI